MAKASTILIKMESTADTGYYYVTKKNPRTQTEKLELRKYDPVIRKHVVFIEGKIKLASGDNFTIDTALDAEKGTQSSVGCTYKELTKNVGVGEQLLIDDGRIVLEIKKIDKTKIITNVITGGILHDTKGLNKKGGISAPSLAKKDFQDIALAAELQVDYLAISYPINAKDINHARDLLRKEGGDAAIISKIERSEAIHNIDELIEASDELKQILGFSYFC